MNLRSPLLLALPAWLAAAVPAVAAPDPPADEPAIEARIDEFRRAGRYGDAAGAARDLADLVGGDPARRPAEVEAARWQAESLARIAGLPDSSRVVMARADRLYHELRESVAQNQAGGSARAEEWLALVQRALGPHCRELVSAHTEVGGYHFFDGNLDACERHFRIALELTRELLGERHREVADRLSNLAIPVTLRGDFVRAEALLRDAVSRLRHEAERDPAREVPVVNNLSSVLERRGDDIGAMELVLEAMALSEAATPAGGAPSVHPGHLNRLAKIHRRLGEPDEAVACARRAIEVHRDSRFTRKSYDLAIAHLVLGEALADRGDCEGALDALDAACALCEDMKGPDHAETGKFVEARARALLACGRVDAAEAAARRAVAVHERKLGARHALTCRSLHTLGLALEAKGDLAAAESTLALAAAAFDAARLGSAEDERASLPLASPYEGLARVQRKLGSPGAWLSCERALARALADWWTPGEVAPVRPAGETDEAMAARLHALENACRELAAAGGAASSRLAAMRAELTTVEAEWAARRADRAAHDVEADAGTVSLARVQAALDESTALIGWIEGRPGDPSGWTYVIRHSGPVRWAPVDAGGGAGAALRDLIDEAAGWPVRVPWSDDVGGRAKALWNERLAPAMPHLHAVDHLVVAASGPMLGIPLEVALGPDGRFAGQRFAITYVPSATVHAMLAERGARRRVSRDDPVLLVGDPIFSRRAPEGPAPPGQIAWRSALAGNADALDRLPRLPGSREEATRVGRLFDKPRTLLGVAASERALVDLARSGELSRFRILHIATHALVDDRAPDRSAVVLSRADLADPVAAAMRGERVYDGLWTAKEIARECRLDADLVTLSGCRTGLGREAPGEGYLGLAHALLRAGARGLVVSLWPVEDEASGLLMRRFYANLLAAPAGKGQSPRPGMSKAEALREAREWLRTYSARDGSRPFEHPVYWAPFVLVGDGR